MANVTVPEAIQRLENIFNRIDICETWKASALSSVISLRNLSQAIGEIQQMQNDYLTGITNEPILLQKQGEYAVEVAEEMEFIHQAIQMDFHLHVTTLLRRCNALGFSDDNVLHALIEVVAAEGCSCDYTPDENGCFSLHLVFAL